MPLSKSIAYLVIHHKLIMRFGLVGVVTFALNCFLVWLFYGLFTIDYRIAVTFAYGITVVAHFFLNRSFTYKNTASPLAHHVWKYVIMLGINFFINLFVSVTTVEVFGLSPYVGVIFATAAIACLSFFLMKNFIFLHQA